MSTGDVHDQRSQPIDGKYWGYLKVKEQENESLKTSQDNHMLYIGFVKNQDDAQIQGKIAKLRDPAGYAKFPKIEIAFISGETSTSEKLATSSREVDPQEYLRPKYGTIDTVFVKGRWIWGYLRTDEKYRHKKHCEGLDHELVLFLRRKKQGILSQNDRIKYMEYQVRATFKDDKKTISKDIMVALIKGRIL